MTAPPPSPEQGRAAARAAQRRLLGRRRALSLLDRVPTAWFATALTGVFLAVTAAFGGLAAVASAPVPDIAVGDTHRNDQLALTVERAVLIDTLPEAGISVDDDQRVLALVVTAENVWDRALEADAASAVAGAVRVGQLGDVAPYSIARFDDSTTDPYLQPGVPAQLVLTWAVDRDLLSDAEDLRLELRDYTLFTGQLITYGQYWDEPQVSARLTVPITDVGAGVSADPDETEEG